MHKAPCIKVIRRSPHGHAYDAAAGLPCTATSCATTARNEWEPVKGWCMHGHTVVDDVLQVRRVQAGVIYTRVDIHKGHGMHRRTVVDDVLQVRRVQAGNDIHKN